MGRRARPPSSFADHAWVQTLDPGCTGESVPRSPRVEATTTLQTTLMSFDNHRLSGANSTSTTLSSGSSTFLNPTRDMTPTEIGRASSRERVVQYVKL